MLTNQCLHCPTPSFHWFLSKHHHSIMLQLYNSSETFVNHAPENSYRIIRQSIQETAGNIQQKEARKSHKHKSQSRMQQIHVNTSKFTYKTSFINLVLVKKDQQLLKMYLLKSIIDRKSSSIKSFSWKEHWACSYNTCWKLKNSFIQEQEPQFWIFHAIFFLW